MGWYVSGLNLLLFIVVGYVAYGSFIRKGRFALVRVMIYVPVLLLVLGIMNIVALNDAAVQQVAEADITTRIIDQTTVEQGDLIVAVSATGSIQPSRQVPLRFQLNAPVREVLVQEGVRVEAGALIAELDTSDLEKSIADAQIALDLQQTAFEQLTNPPREVDIAAAEAALAAAQAQLSAASATGPTAQQDEIARLQVELAKNQTYQLQLQRDALQTTDTTASLFGSFSIPTDLNIDFGSIDPLPALDPLDFPTVDPADIADANEVIGDINTLIASGGDISSSLNDALAGLNEVLAASSGASAAQLQAQIDQLNSNVESAIYGIQAAEASYQSTVNKGADAGSLASANAGVIQAQIALDRLTNGADALDLARAQVDLDIARLTVEQAQLTTEQGQLIAPFAGVLAENNLTVGEPPPVQGIGVLLIDDSSYYVDLPIDETDVVKIQVGQRVEFVVDALPSALVTGKVERIAFTPLRIGQLVTYTTRVRLDDTEAGLRVGMSVTANVIVQERQAVLLLRNRFIRVDPLTGNALVTLLAGDGSVREQVIILGERNDVFSEVVAGLAMGDSVVLLPDVEASAGGFFGG